MRGELKTEQNCNILTPTLIAITAFLSRSPRLLNRGPGGLVSLGHGPHSGIFSPTDWVSELQLLNRRSWRPPLLGAGSLYNILSPTNSNFLCTELYYFFTPTQFNLSTDKVIPLIPSTGCPCYLQRCISYFDSSARFNMQQHHHVRKRWWAITISQGVTEASWSLLVSSNHCTCLIFVSLLGQS